MYLCLSSHISWCVVVDVSTSERARPGHQRGRSLSRLTIRESWSSSEDRDQPYFYHGLAMNVFVKSTHGSLWFS